jgi:hypothetical protein
VAKESRVEFTPFWAVETPAGQRVIVKREDSAWVVICDRGEPVRHRVLDVALIEAVRHEVEAHWFGSPGRWASMTADDIASPWRNEHDESEGDPWSF